MIRRPASSTLCVCLTFAAAAIAATGCSQSNSAAGPAVMSPVQHPVLPNVPVPNGFELVDDRSRVSNAGAVRFAQCQFTGKADRARVFEFYKEYMPTAGWTLRDERLINGTYELRFEGPAERCDVRLSRAGRDTLIDVDVRPSSPGGSEPVRTESAPPPRR